MINYMDKLVGRLMDAVEELGIRQNTYVFFMGDNGTHEQDFHNPHTGEPHERAHTRHTRAGRVNGGKFDPNDAGTHVPLLVWGPKTVPRGSVCDDLIDVVDLFPTFCQLSQIAIPKSLKIDGLSFAQQIHGKPGIPRKWVLHGITPSKRRFGGGGVSLFDGSWRYFVRNKYVSMGICNDLGENPLHIARDNGDITHQPC